MERSRNTQLEAPEGASVAELGIRARTMRLVTISLDDGSYERTVPRPVAILLEWPQAPDAETLGAAVDCAMERALMQRIEKLASARERSTRELRERFAQERFDERAIEVALERAVSYGWVDDARFARSFALGKRYAGWGDQRIARELKRYGVNAQAALHELDEEEGEGEVDRALRVLRSKSVSGRNVRDKLFRRLISRGFSVGVASEAVSRHLSSPEDR